MLTPKGGPGTNQYGVRGTPKNKAKGAVPKMTPAANKDKNRTVRDVLDVSPVGGAAPHSLQTAAPLQKLRAPSYTRMISDFVHRYQKGELDVDPPYQRGAVWSTEQKIALVKSFMQGVPIPALVINQRDTAQWRNRYWKGQEKAWYEQGQFYGVVDGKQRILAMHDWFSGDLAVPASWFPAVDIVDVEQTRDGPYVRFNGLSVLQQRYFHNDATLPTVEPSLGSLEEEAALYLLLNGGGVAQTPEDMQRAKRIVHHYL